jgi:hypothetical protein
MGCFYNHLKNRVYSFYRQGEAFCIDPQNLENYRFERITDLYLGEMQMVYDEVLVCSSSNKVVFFKQIWDKMEELTKWIAFKEIKIRGFVNYIKGGPNENHQI